MVFAPFVRLGEYLSVRKRRRDFPVVRTLIDPRSATRLLDIGGGAGSATSLFALDSGSAVVLEPNRRKLLLGRSRHPTIAFIAGGGEALPFRGETFDRAVAIVSLHHVSDPDAALREAKRVLRPMGRLVLHELYPADRGTKASPSGRPRHDSHPTLFGPDALKQRVEAQGFRNVDIRQGVRGYFVTGTK